jgi:hypothetical protein
MRPGDFLRAITNRALFSLEIEGLYPRRVFRSDSKLAAKDFLELHSEAMEKEYPEVDLIEARLGFKISRDWLGSLALSTQVTQKKSALNWQHGRILYALLREHLDLTAQPQQEYYFFETGTARGFSAVVAGRALIDAGQSGTVFTLDPLPHDTEMLWNAYSDLTIGAISRRRLLRDWPLESSKIVFLQGWSKRAFSRTVLPRVNFAFLDAQHKYFDVMREFDWVKRHQQRGDRILFDDVTQGQFRGVVRAVNEIESEGTYEITRFASAYSRGYALAVRK